MKKQYTIVLLLALASLVLTGCMFPEDEKAENQIPYDDQLATVQKAVDTFREDTGGLVPIKTRDMDTDIYIKYLIDFERLVPKYLASPPANAYEKGGIYQYVIWDPENTAEVKLVDLNIPDLISKVRIRTMNRYMPVAEPINAQAYHLDYKSIGYKEPLTIKSPYSTHELPIFMTGDGNLYVDYTLDLAEILREEKPDVKEGDDIRSLLIERSPILPAYSIPYTVDENNEPVMMFGKLQEEEAKQRTTQESEEKEEESAQ